ncbi:hypothetical protein ACQZ63_25665 [Agrobacterium sp. CG160-95]|uniref:hypothetical protein n=1 Tax=Agrobacterium tumefaciens TaxID=358 RepID=UPI0001FC2168|nr:hypothetical protein [Agrobacterium tumefaciens]ADY67893.1 hypothetical protein AGROH133_14466 [Agrobacterium tumefaciens]
MKQETPKPGAPGTTVQSPRWEGPQDTRPAGYMPAKDDPEVDRDSVGENLGNPCRKNLGDAGKVKGDT